MWCAALRGATLSARHEIERPGMKRRGFISLLGGAVAVWPLAVGAQQPDRLRHVGVLIAYPENDPRSQAFVAAFARGLGRFGWAVGKNIRIDYRFAAGDPTLFKTYAAELVGLMPDAILASNAPAVAAVRQQTRTIPIVFVLQPDPVGQGIVQSLARPGGNLTGFSSYDAPIIGKWLQLLKEVAPSVARVAVIFNPDTALAPSFDREIEAARSFGVTVTLAPVHDEAAMEATIAAQGRAGGILHRPHPQGRQPGRPPGSVPNEILAGHQPQDRQGARAHGAAIDPSAR